MPKKLTKARQQEVVADFIYEKDLELCMFVYLNAFLDMHRREYPQEGNTYGTKGIKALLEASYQGIRERLLANGLLTAKAVGEYLMGLDSHRKMPRSNEANVNHILNDFVHLLPNMGGLRCPPLGSVKREGFAIFSKLFCDSIVFWGLYNGQMEKTKGTTIGKYIAEIRDVFAHSPLDAMSVKLVQCGRINAEDESFPKKVRKRHRAEHKDVPYEA
ncbi:hypothetical protein EDD11_000356, partial [Mortierella claussenii]